MCKCAPDEDSETECVEDTSINTHTKLSIILDVLNSYSDDFSKVNKIRAIVIAD